MPSVDLVEMGESAKRCRRRIVDMVYKAQSGHPDQPRRPRVLQQIVLQADAVVHTCDQHADRDITEGEAPGRGVQDRSRDRERESIRFRA